MKSRILSFLACVLMTVQMQAQETTYAQEAMRYFELNGTMKQYNQAVDQLFVMLKQNYSNANVPDEVWASLETKKPQELIKIKSLLVSAYRGNFSKEEIHDMIEFYDSGAGRQLVTDPTAMSEENKADFQKFQNSPTGKKIADSQDSLKKMVSEVSEFWSRDLYKEVVAELKSSGYNL